MNMDQIETLRGGNLLLRTQVMPDREIGLPGPSTRCRYVGWPTYLNCARYLTVVRTASDCVMGLMRHDPTLEGNEVRLTLTAGPTVTWWKGVEVVREIVSVDPLTSSDGEERFETLAGVYTQDRYHGPDSSHSIRVDDYPQRSLFLQFRKAGAFGIHRTLYRIPLRLPGGHALMLNWERDCPATDL